MGPPVVAVRVMGEPSRLVRHVAEVLCQSGLAPAGDEAAHGLVEVRVRAGRGEVVAPPSTTPVSRHLDIGVWRCGDRLVLDDGRSRLELAPGEGLVTAGLDPDLAASPVWSRPNLILLYGVLTILRFRGVFALHAAAATYGENGCLLVASSGSGKSTTVLTLVRQGWSFVSDDSVLLRSTEGVVWASPLRRDLYVKHAPAAPPAGELWERVTLSTRELHRLRVEEAYPSRSAGECVPRLLVFPTVAERADSALEPIATAEALYSLLHQSTITDLEPSMARQHTEVLRGLMTQCSTWRLWAGRDILEHPEVLARMLEERLEERANVQQE